MNNLPFEEIKAALEDAMQTTYTPGTLPNSSNRRLFVVLIETLLSRFKWKMEDIDGALQYPSRKLYQYRSRCPINDLEYALIAQLFPYQEVFVPGRRDEPRNHHLNLYYSDTEYAQLQAFAAGRNMTISDAIRSVVYAEVPQTDTTFQMVVQAVEQEFGTNYRQVRHLRGLQSTVHKWIIYILREHVHWTNTRIADAMYKSATTVSSFLASSTILPDEEERMREIVKELGLKRAQ